MKSDFTRSTFDREKAYSRVIFQQGRPFSDADFNEQTDSLLHLSREIVRDLIGHHGAPATIVNNELTSDSFKITPQGTPSATPDFDIGNGPYYVDGFRCESAGGRTYLDQPYFPKWPERAPRKEDLQLPPFLIYLDVWEHHRTWLDDIRITDPALGGIDTTTRAQVIWQVKILSKDDLERLKVDLSTNALRELDLKTKLENNRGLLKARIKDTPDATKSCEVKVAAQYRGTENQLYRIEIHRGGVACKPREKAENRHATFKWSRENGSVVARWLPPDPHDQADGAVLRLEGPSDKARGFSKGDWVELTDETRELRGEPGELIKVENVEDGKLTLASAPNRGNYPEHPRVRRWDHKVDDATKAVRDPSGAQALPLGIVIREGEPIDDPADSKGDHWIELENGIEIAFIPPSTGDPHQYRNGDFWLIPARFATGNIEWPQTPPGKEERDAATSQSDPRSSPSRTPTPKAVPPHGIEHHYAPLMIRNSDGPIDLRRGFAPLAQKLAQ